MRLPTLDGVAWSRGLRQRLRRFLAAAASAPGARRILWSYALTDGAKRRLLDPSVAIPDSWSSSRLLDGHARGRPWGDGAMTMDLSTYLPNEMLTKADRMTMAHGLEGRVPLLDHRLVELCVPLPVSRKMRGWRPKAVLKDAMAPWLPAWVIARRKHGFNLPVDAWIRGAMRPLALDLLSAATVRERGWFRPDVVDGLLRAELEEGEQVGQVIWGLMMLELWYRQRPVSVDATAGARV
jgi:asparagine synthase (glutamine-hydrolysing)